MAQASTPEREIFSIAIRFEQRPHFMKFPSASFWTAGLSEVIFQPLPPPPVFISSA
jgi:hypothetical protein